MKLALFFSLAGCALLALAYYQGMFIFHHDALDLHISDSFIILEYWTAAVFFILLLGTLFSLGGIIGTGFRRRSFWLLFLFFIAANASVGWWYYTQFTT